MPQPYSMFIAGKIKEMRSVKFFLKHPVDEHLRLTLLTIQTSTDVEVEVSLLVLVGGWLGGEKNEINAILNSVVVELEV